MLNIRIRKKNTTLQICGHWFHINLHNMVNKMNLCIIQGKYLLYITHILKWKWNAYMKDPYVHHELRTCFWIEAFPLLFFCLWHRAVVGKSLIMTQYWSEIRTHHRPDNVKHIIWYVLCMYYVCLCECLENRKITS